MNLRDLAGLDLWALVAMELSAWILRLDLDVVEHLEKPPAAGLLWKNWKVDEMVILSGKKMTHLETLCLLDLKMQPVHSLNLLQTEANLDLNVEAVLAQRDWFPNPDLAHYCFQVEGVL